MFEKEAEEYGKTSTDSYKDGLVDIDDISVLDEAITEGFKNGAEFGYNECKDKLDIAIEIIERMKDLFFDCWQERGYEAIKFEQKVNDFLKENK